MSAKDELQNLFLQYIQIHVAGFVAAVSKN